jgi:hypothetical protein
LSFEKKIKHLESENNMLKSDNVRLADERTAIELSLEVKRLSHIFNYAFNLCAFQQESKTVFLSQKSALQNDLAQIKVV